MAEEWYILNTFRVELFQNYLDEGLFSYPIPNIW